MPIIGITASSIQPSIFAGDYEPIATVSVGSGGSANIQFTSIPSGYQHLQIRGITRTTRNDASVDGLYVRANSDTGNNYSYHQLNGNGSSASSTAGTNASAMILTFQGVSALTTANIFTAWVIDILDYKDTNKYKTVRGIVSYDANGSGNVALGSGSWRNTNAITSLTLLAEGSFVQYTHAALYGIK
jgi:hypothetical protein